MEIINMHGPDNPNKPIETAKRTIKTVSIHEDERLQGSTGTPTLPVTNPQKASYPVPKGC